MQGTGTSRRKLITFNIIAVALIAIFIVVDQVLKNYFKTNYSSGREDYIIDGFFYFTYSFNTGAAFSLFADKPWGMTFFKVLTCVALVLFVLLYVYSCKKRYKFLTIALVLVLSGTIGNFIDRIMYNGVVDFVGLIFFGWRFPIFNFADVCMCIGVIMTIIHFLFLDKNAIFRKNGKKKNTDTK